MFGIIEIKNVFMFAKLHISANHFESLLQRRLTFQGNCHYRWHVLLNLRNVVKCRIVLTCGGCHIITEWITSKQIQVS